LAKRPPFSLSQIQTFGGTNASVLLTAHLLLRSPSGAMLRP
jgi:hypothetical protein